MEAIFNLDNTNNTDISVLFDEDKSSDLLLIAFGGGGYQMVIPTFEFVNSMKQYQATKVFIRDFQQVWYTKGLTGISNNISETVTYLESLIERHKSKKVFFIGNSAGGFAAILFGRLLGIDEVHAFVPTTFINRINRFRYRDNRWKDMIRATYKNAVGKEYFDLTDLFKGNSDYKTEFHIYWDRNERLDNIHANRMQFKNFVLHPYEEGGHNLIRLMRDRGELKLLFDQLFEQTKQFQHSL